MSHSTPHRERTLRCFQPIFSVALVPVCFRPWKPRGGAHCGPLTKQRSYRWLKRAVSCVYFSCLWFRPGSRHRTVEESDSDSEEELDGGTRHDLMMNDDKVGRCSLLPSIRELKHRRFWFTDVNRKSVFRHCSQCAGVDVFDTEVMDVKRGCLPFVLCLETIDNSEIVTSGWRPWIKKVSQ